MLQCKQPSDAFFVQRPGSSESRPGTSASRPGTAESGEIANNSTQIENMVQRRQHTTDIRPAKLKRRLSVSQQTSS